MTFILNSAKDHNKTHGCQAVVSTNMELAGLYYTYGLNNHDRITIAFSYYATIMPLVKKHFFQKAFE